jgi:hypothetical protein
MGWDAVTLGLYFLLFQRIRVLHAEAEPATNNSVHSAMLTAAQSHAKNSSDDKP